MGYYMRFISTDPRDLTLAVLRAALASLNSAYRLDDTTGATATGGESADLFFAPDTHAYGEVEINRPGDGLFDDERAELLEALPEEGEPDALARVKTVLEGARTIVAVRVLSGGRSSDQAFERIDPLLEWLQTNRTGLLQADSEGYYEGQELILEE